MYRMYRLRGRRFARHNYSTLRQRFRKPSKTLSAKSITLRCCFSSWSSCSKTIFVKDTNAYGCRGKKKRQQRFTRYYYANSWRLAECDGNTANRTSHDAHSTMGALRPRRCCCFHFHYLMFAGSRPICALWWWEYCERAVHTHWPPFTVEIFFLLRRADQVFSDQVGSGSRQSI